jgi:hypothetical protein
MIKLIIGRELLVFWDRHHLHYLLLNLLNFWLSLIVKQDWFFDWDRHFTGSFCLGLRVCLFITFLFTLWSFQPIIRLLYFFRFWFRGRCLKALDWAELLMDNESNNT